MATNLELEALNLVNEDILGPEVTDEEKYAAILETRKNRKAGENLFNFLERQVKDQMAVALGQPLQDVSEVVLKKTAAKTINSTMTKYRPAGLPRGPGSRFKHLDRPPPRTLEGPDGGGFIPPTDLSRPVQNHLRDLSAGAGVKMSLLKMQIVRSDEGLAYFQRIRACIQNNDFSEMDSLLSTLEDQVRLSLSDLQYEIAEGVNLVQVVESLIE